MRPFKRAQRVAEEIRKILAEALTYEARDPRLHKAVILNVEVSEDLLHAKVYFTASEELDQVHRALQKAKGFLRTAVARNLHIRQAPDLSFHPVHDADLILGGEEPWTDSST